MKVTYVIRSPGTGYSIETLFGSITGVLSRPGSLITPSWLVLPRISQGLLTVWQNIVFVRKARLSKVHITGDIHYAVLGARTKKTVLTIHDCVILRKNSHNWVRFLVFKWLWYSLPIRRAAIVTTISKKTHNELRHYLGKLADGILVVPNSYDPAFTYSPRPFNSDYPNLLHIGTAPHKNLSRLIAALESFPCRLVIVGALTETDLSSLQAHHIDYEQHTNISQEQIIRLYDKCNVVTFVSLYEGFGMPVLEGQVVGRPVVTSNISPMTDVGGSGACYVDPTDVTDIRRGILRVCQDEAYRNELITNGRINAQAYTVERVAAQYVALYNQLDDSTANTGTT